jgi:hypothetical protein
MRDTTHNRGRVLIVGAGDLGTRVLRGLADCRADEVRLLGRNPENVLRASNLATFCAVQRGLDTTYSHAVADVENIDQTAAAIADYAPDIIFLAVSLQSWWVITTLPDAAFQRLYAAQYGPWLPMHLWPVLCVMRAVRDARSDAVVVNSAYPDVVHPVLASAGLAPQMGIGNVANNVPAITVVAAEQLGVPRKEVDVRLVAHHYVSHRLSRTGDAGQAELILSVVHDGNPVVDAGALLRRLPHDMRRTGGLAGQAMTAASALSVLEPLVSRAEALVHMPGPNGLPGGYPVRLSGREVEVELPPGTSMAEARRVNLAGQHADGVAEVASDGTVTFTDESMGVLEAELGYSCTKMSLDDVEYQARELGARFAEYRDRVCS